MAWLVMLAMGWFQTAAAAPPCLRTYGITACGYSCLAAHGHVACAATAHGTCAASGDSVVCWDPPDWVPAHYGDRTPRARCITRSGHTECGYHCEAHGEEVKCAQSPDGICRATALGITCWDPAPSTYCADDRRLPRPMCVALDDVVTCGYQCEARNGRMACAGTPGGTCQVMPDGIFCTDPEPPAMCDDGPCDAAAAPRAWCARPVGR